MSTHDRLWGPLFEEYSLRKFEPQLWELSYPQVAKLYEDYNGGLPLALLESSLSRFNHASNFFNPDGFEFDSLLEVLRKHLNLSGQTVSE